MNSSRSVSSKAAWPSIVQDWPEVEMHIQGLRGRMLKSGIFRILFLTADEEVVVPPHQHGEQWGVVISGSMELTIGSETRHYHRGDTHHIPTGVDHQALLHQNWQGLYVFTKRDAS